MDPGHLNAHQYAMTGHHRSFSDSALYGIWLPRTDTPWQVGEMLFPRCMSSCRPRYDNIDVSQVIR